MCGQCFACFFDRLNERVAELFTFKVCAHSIDKPLPELLAGLFMDVVVAYRGELGRMRRDKDKHGVPLGGSMHRQPVKFLLRRDQRVAFQLAALSVDADLPERFYLDIPDRSHDAVVLEPAKEFPGSHLLYQPPLEPPPPKLPPPLEHQSLPPHLLGEIPDHLGPTNSRNRQVAAPLLKLQLRGLIVQFVEGFELEFGQLRRGLTFAIAE